MIVGRKELMGIRRDLHNNTLISVVLIKWQGLPALEATWEHYQTIDVMFSHFRLGIATGQMIQIRFIGKT